MITLPKVETMTNEERLENLKYTRDFDLYLDILNVLKKEYLIILCLKNTSDQKISEKTVEKIHSTGFRNFTTEPDMKYVGILNDGNVICDNASDAYKPPVYFEGSVLDAKLYISFEGKETEISINGKDQSLNDKGVNIAVYEIKNRKIVDASCYNASETSPAFYHRNFYYSKQYIDSHIYVPEIYKESISLPLKKSYFSNRRLNVREVERGIFLPTKDENVYDESGRRRELSKALGGVCDESFNFIAGHQLHSTRNDLNDDRHISGSYEVPKENITYIDETVLYGGSLIEHPGHLITECFADRLWWVVQNADSDIKIAVEIIWKNTAFSSNYNSFVMEFLDAFGISRDRLIVIEKPTQFKKIIIPDQSSIPLNYCFPYEFTSEYIKPFQHITKQLTPGKYKKIYLSHNKLYRKSIIGEEYFIDFFEKRGFKIIHPEDHTIKEKAELMYGADEVVTIDGTNSLFSVFCKPTVRLTILTRRMDFWDTPQQLINEALGIKEFFLVNTSGNFLENFSDKAFGNFSRGMAFVYATKEFKKYVKYIYNEELDITPEESLKKYLYDYLTYFPVHYSQAQPFCCVKNIKMTDILRSMSEVFLDKEFDTSSLVFTTDDEELIRRLRLQLQAEKESNAEKMKLLSDKAKGFVEENARLKQSLARLEDENKQLRAKNSEMASYVAEINSLLDALESENGSSE